MALAVSVFRSRVVPVTITNVSSSPYYMLLGRRQVVHPQLMECAMTTTRKAKRCAILTAMFGSYETTPRNFPPQDLECDAYLFTDQNFTSPVWTVITTPFHEQDTSDGPNGIKRNPHPFNLAKYYKMQFHRLPIDPPLTEREFVIWLDGNNELLCKDATVRLGALAKKSGGLALYETNSEWKQGWVYNELKDSLNVPDKYGRQDLFGQYFRMHEDGWCERWWVQNRTWPCEHIKPWPEWQKLYDLRRARYAKSSDNMDPPQPPDPDRYTALRTTRPALVWEHNFTELQKHLIATASPQFGVWVTSLIVYDMTNPKMAEFLDTWWQQNVHGTTQDQIGFSYAVWKVRILPLTLPTMELDGNMQTGPLHHKHRHGSGAGPRLICNDTNWKARTQSSSLMLRVFKLFGMWL
eukprot:PhM_4_TR9620/c0_g1_i1/m.22860